MREKKCEIRETITKFQRILVEVANTAAQSLEHELVRKKRQFVRMRREKNVLNTCLVAE